MWHFLYCTANEILRLGGANGWAVFAGSVVPACSVKPKKTEMKQSWMISLAVGIFLLSCQSEAPQTESADPMNELRSLPENIAAIENTVSAIDVVLDTLQERGPITVTRGDVNWEVYAYYQDQDPALVRALFSGGEQLYYFFDRRIIRLQEFANLDNGQVEERIFSYNENEVVEAKSRKADSRDQLGSEAFSNYRSPYGKMDFRLDVNQVNGSATSFIYGQ